MSMDRTPTSKNDRGLDAHLSEETLSALSDGRLSEPERAAAQRHLDACADCTQALTDYASLTQLMRGLPRPKRSFQLSEEQARVRANRRWRLPAFTASLPALRAAAIAAALLLIVVTGIDRFTQPGSNGGNGSSSVAFIAPTTTAAGTENTTMLQKAVVAPTAPVFAGSAPEINNGFSGGSSSSAAVDKIAPTARLASPEASATSSPSPGTSPIVVPAPALTASSPGSRRTGWRVVELGLGLLLLWLIVSYAGAWQSARNRQEL